MAAINNQLKVSTTAGSIKSSGKSFFFLTAISIIFILISCGAEFGQTVISKPDEYRHTYEANEKVILQAMARIFKDKNMGSNVRIDLKKNQLETDYFIEGDWRTKSTVKVKKLNWKEREVVLAITTEKKTSTGWEMRRLLDKDEYVKLFDKIDLAIYEEMARIE
jgi:hypothetical protein